MVSAYYKKKPANPAGFKNLIIPRHKKTAGALLRQAVEWRQRDFPGKRILLRWPGNSTAPGDVGAEAHITWIEGELFEDFSLPCFFIAAISPSQ